MSVVTVELADDILERVRQYSEKKQIAVEEVFNASLRKFLLLAELTDLQNRLDGKAQELGFDSEDDLLDAIS